MHLLRTHSGLSMPAGDFGAAVQNASHSVPDIVRSKMFHSGLTLAGGLSQSFSEQALATASLAQSSPHSQLLHGADITQQLQLALAQKITENQQLQQRVQDLDAQLQQQRDNSNAQANDIKKLAGQLVLLEEKLNYTTACTQRLQEDNQRLSNHNEHLQQHAADLQQQLAAAVSLESAALSPTADSAIGTDLFLATRPLAVTTDGRPSTAATPTASPPPAHGISGSSISAFAAAAAAEEHQAAAAAAGNGNSSSTSSTPIPRAAAAAAAAAGQGGLGMSRALSMGHTPVGHQQQQGFRNTVGGGFGSTSLSPHLLSPQHPPGTVGLLLESLQEQSNNLSLSPAQRSGQLSHALSMSAAAPAGGSSRVQQQQHSNSSSSQDFTRDAEVWLPGPPRPHRTQSLLSARDLNRELNAIQDSWPAGSSSSSTTPAPATAIPISSSSSRPIPTAAPTAPQPILAHQHSRRAHAHPAAAAAAAGSGLGTSAFDSSWQGAGLAPLSHSVGAAAGSSGMGFGFSPASYGDPGFLGGRHNSMLDAAAAAVPAAATPGHSDSVTAADILGYSASLGNMAAAASLTHDSDALLQLGGIEHSIALTAAAAAAAAAGLPTVAGSNGASVQNLQALLLLQQQQQLQQHQHQQQIMTAAAVAAAAAATAAQQQQLAVHQQQLAAAAAYAAGGGTVRGGKPVPGLAAAAMQGGHPMHIPNAHSAAAAAAAKGGSSADDVVSRGGRSFSSGRENGLMLGSSGGADRSHIPANIVQKWDDTWGPEIDRSNSADTEQPDTDDSCDQDGPNHSNHHSNSVPNTVTHMTNSLQRSTSSAAAISGAGGLVLPSGSSNSSGLVTSVSAQELTSSSSMNLGSAAAAAAAAAEADGEGGLGQELDAAAQNARLRSKEDACPNTCVYVGFLGWWVTERDLVEYFSPYGELVSVRLLISKKSRRSREQAFVEYADVEQAQRAITWLDTIDYPALVKQLGCGGLVVRFADRKKPSFEG